MPNQTEIDEILIGMAYKDGINVGLQIADDIRTGKIIIQPNKTLEITLDKFFTHSIPLGHRTLAQFGSPVVMAVGNTGLAVTGGAILLKSTHRYLQTQNRLAKACYVLSGVCSGTGMISSTVAVYCDRCGLDRTGMLGDSFGALFLTAGNRVHELGEIVERQKKFQLRALNPFTAKKSNTPIFSRFSKFRGGSSDIILPSGKFQRIITIIPCQKIIVVTGVILTVYGYGKLLISSMRYGQTLHAKYIERKNRNKSQTIVESYSIIQPAKFLAHSFLYQQSKIKFIKIYRFALDY